MSHLRWNDGRCDMTWPAKQEAINPNSIVPATAMAASPICKYEYCSSSSQQERSEGDTKSHNTDRQTESWPQPQGCTSIRTGQLLATAILRASAVALYTARASPPSTLMLAMPYDGPRPAIPSPVSHLHICLHNLHQEYKAALHLHGT